MQVFNNLINFFARAFVNRKFSLQKLFYPPRSEMTLPAVLYVHLRYFRNREKHVMIFLSDKKALSGRHILKH